MNLIIAFILGGAAALLANEIWRTGYRVCRWVSEKKFERWLEAAEKGEKYV